MNASLTPREEALRFAKAHQTCVLGTISLDGQPHGATVTYACEDDFTIYFATHSNSRKARDLAANPAVSLVIGVDPRELGTIQAHGIARLVEDSHLDPFSQIIDAVSDNWPPLRRDGLDFAFYEVKAAWLRWSDFAPKGTADTYSVTFQIIPQINDEGPDEDPEPLEDYD